MADDRQRSPDNEPDEPGGDLPADRGAAQEQPSGTGQPSGIAPASGTERPDRGQESAGQETAGQETAGPGGEPAEPVTPPMGGAPPAGAGQTGIQQQPTDPWASGSETTILPPSNQPRPPDNRWTARANVAPTRPPQPPSYGPPPYGPPPETYEYQGGDDGRRWWAPVVIALVALVLLAILGTGIWLIVRSRDQPIGPPPRPQPTSTTSGSPTVSATPSAPSSPSPSPLPSMVTIPNEVVGKSAPDVRKVLQQLGLVVDEVPRPDANARPGIVLDVSPPPGTLVPVGSVVRVIVAVPPTSTPEPTATTSAPPPASPTPTATPTKR